MVQAAQTVTSWGRGNEGQLGDGTANTSNVPINITGSGALSGKRVVQIVGGAYHCIALCSDGTLAAWGNGSNGELGNGSTANQLLPVDITQSGALSGKRVTQISGGLYHTLALCSDGTLVAWGSNGTNQVGDGTYVNRTAPVDITNSGVLGGKRVVQISAQGSHSFALCDDGTVAAWGFNVDGQLGDGSNTIRAVPVDITSSGALSGKRVVQITGGDYHSLALCSDGTLAGWGANNFGQLGDGTTIGHNEPVDITSAVLGGREATQIECGSYYTMVLCSNGSIAACGRNNAGQLGNGTNTNSSIAVDVSTAGALSGKTVSQISAEEASSSALCSDGTVVTWGNNNSGQLGDGTFADSNVPVDITQSGALNGKRVTSLASGRQHRLALATTSSAPTVTTGSATNVTTNSATLGATVNPQELTTTAKIEYGQTTDYGSEASLTLSPNDGGLDQNLSVAVSGLSPHKLYHYRVSAINSLGTTNGADATFTTLNTAPQVISGGLTLDERTSATITSANLNATDADGDTLTFTIKILPTQGTLKLNNVALGQDDTFTAEDIAANKLTYTHTGAGDDSFGFGLSDGSASSTGAFFLTVTPVPPTVVSVVCADATPTGAASVRFTVTFSEAVTGVDASDFVVFVTDLADVSITNVEGSGSTYTVTLSTGFGQGNLQLRVDDDDSIMDSTGNPLGGPGSANGRYNQGQTYAIDRLAPIVTIDQGTGQSDPTASTSVEFTVAFSESVTGFDQSDITLSGTSNVGTATVEVNGSGYAYTVTVSGLTKAGTVVASIGAGAATDALGNASKASTSTDNSVTFGHTPSALSLSRNSVQEKLPIGSFVGLLSTADSDVGETFTYSLVGGDTSAFAIDGAYLRTNAVLDEAVKNSYNLTIRTTDNRGLFFEQAFVITVVETTKPEVTISSPTNNQKVLINALTGNVISGTATDNKGVSAIKVRLARKRGTANEYWDGNSFGANQVFLPATVTTVGNTSVTWKLDNQLPSESKLDVGAYGVQVYALDAANNKSAYANTSFNILRDVTAPTLSISTPTLNQKLLINEFNGSTVGGTVNDDLGVAAVKVRLSRKRGTTNYYWNGTDFGTASAYVDATIAGATWNLGALAPADDKLDTGAYLVEAYAVDGGGNKSAAAKVSFSLSTDYTAPSVAISTPTPSQVIKINEFGAGVITGTAADNIGVTSVKLKLQRKRGTSYEYWNGTAFTTTAAIVDASYNSESGTWSYDNAIPGWALDAGGYTLYATTIDAAGNKTTSAARIFNIIGSATAADAPVVADKSAGSS